MRKPRDWEWKKVIETPDNTFQIGEMMQKEEKDEVQALYREIPGLREYVEADHTVQDFVDNYETLGFDIGVFQYHLCRFRWNLDQLVKMKENLEDWKPIPYESPIIPDKLALKIVGDVVPEKYKTWGFALYFTDNDFGCPLEMVGKIIGEQYKKEFFDVVNGICEFEEDYVIADEYCDTHLGKYFDEYKLRSLIDSLYPAGEILSSWGFNQGIPTDDNIDSTRGYLEIPKRKIKIGSEEEVISWLVETFGEPEDKNWKYPWCNAEVLLVQFSPDKVEVKVI